MEKAEEEVWKKITGNREDKTMHVVNVSEMKLMKNE